MECEERDRLLGSYHRAVAEVFRASSVLSERAGKSSLDDYGVLLRERNRAKVRASQERSAYEQHITMHACEPVGDLRTNPSTKI